MLDNESHPIPPTQQLSGTALRDQGNDEGRIWLQKAAESGVAYAQFTIASDAVRDSRPLLEPVQAFAREAWRQSFVPAGALLDEMVRQLYGRDYMRFTGNYSVTAAAQGDSNAQYFIGYLNAQGIGRPRDFLAAARWFSLAMAQEHKAAASAMETVSSLISSENLARARSFARDEFLRLAKDDETLLGKAAKWCFSLSANQEACLRRSYWEHLSCSLHYSQYLRTAGWDETIAYKNCRSLRLVHGK